MKRRCNFKKVMLTTLLVGILSMAPAMVSFAAVEEYAEIFDPIYYYNTYPDLQENIGYAPEMLLQHYLQIGQAEGRIGKDPTGAVAVLDPSVVPVLSVDAGKIVSTNGIPDLIGSYTTYYKAGGNRGNNVELAASKLNGAIIAPGEEFSYSNYIGKRTAENGFKVAHIYVNKQVVDGMGGGICQVSSTLYAAMKVANVPASERHAHSLPVDYLPAGWDATVSEGSLDLKLLNIYDTSLAIESSAANGVLTVNLYKYE